MKKTDKRQRTVLTFEQLKRLIKENMAESDVDDSLAEKIVDVFLYYYDLDEYGNPTREKDDDFGQIDSVACEALDKIWKLVRNKAPAIV